MRMDQLLEESHVPIHVSMTSAVDVNHSVGTFLTYLQKYHDKPVTYDEKVELHEYYEEWLTGQGSDSESCTSTWSVGSVESECYVPSSPRKPDTPSYVSSDGASSSDEECVGESVLDLVECALECSDPAPWDVLEAMFDYLKEEHPDMYVQLEPTFERFERLLARFSVQCSLDALSENYPRELQRIVHATQELLGLLQRAEMASHALPEDWAVQVTRQMLDLLIQVIDLHAQVSETGERTESTPSCYYCVHEYWPYIADTQCRTTTVASFYTAEKCLAFYKQYLKTRPHMQRSNVYMQEYYDE